MVKGNAAQRPGAQTQIDELLAQHDNLQAGFKAFLRHVRGYPPGVFSLASLMENTPMPPSRIMNERDATLAGAQHNESVDQGTSVADDASLSVVRVDDLGSTSEPSTSHSMTYSHSPSTSSSTAYSGRRVTGRNVLAGGRSVDLVGLEFLDLAIPYVPLNVASIPAPLPPVPRIPVVLAAPDASRALQRLAAEPRSVGAVPNNRGGDDASDQDAPADLPVPHHNPWWLRCNACLSHCFRFWPF